MLRENTRDKLKRVDTSKKIFTLLVILYPILNRYASFLPLLTLSETLLLMFLIFVMVYKKIRIAKATVPFVLYLLGLFFYYLFSSNFQFDDNLGTMSRLIFLYVAITLLGRGFIDGDRAIKWLNIIAGLMVCYCILQWMAAKVGIYLTTYIPGLPIMAEDRDEYILSQRQYDITFRPYGLLNEPAALCCYLVLPLIINLFSHRKIEYRLKKAIFISLGCFISMSSTGILMCGAAWFIFIFNNKTDELKKYRKYVIFLMIITIAIIPGTEIGETFMERTFGGSISNAKLENTTRFNALDILSIFFRNEKDLVFGVGMAYPGFYLPGFIRILYNIGLVGLSIVILQFVTFYKRGDLLQKKITIFYSVLNVGTEILLGNFAIYYLSFILADKEEIY